MTDVTSPPIRARQRRPADLEQYRHELTGYCYRMLGSSTEAEDVVQEVLLRAWRGLEDFEERSSLRTWLYRIATNRCIDHLRQRPRRALPMDLGPASTVHDRFGDPTPAHGWVEPMPDGRVVPNDADPALQAEVRDTLRLALIVALQHLAPKQRAVLILREVLGWPARNVADLLDTSVPAVNSALQRARATLADRDLDAGDLYQPADEQQRRLLDRYLDAFEHYDLDAFEELLHEDATQSMPPWDFWLRGRDQVRAWMEGPGAGCRGSVLQLVAANGMPAVAQWRADPEGGHSPWALHVLTIRDGQVAGIESFLDTDRWFPLFDLPASPTEARSPSA